MIRHVVFIVVQLDAKNSPLALLAQTCSSIGHDVVPIKQSTSSDHHGDRKHSTTKDSHTHHGGSGGSNGSSPTDDKKTPDRNKTKTSSGDKQISSSSLRNHNNNNTNGGVSGGHSSSGFGKGGSFSRTGGGQHKEALSPPSVSRERCSSSDRYSSRTSPGPCGVGRNRSTLKSGSPLTNPYKDGDRVSASLQASQFEQPQRLSPSSPCRLSASSVSSPRTHLNHISTSPNAPSYPSLPTLLSVYPGTLPHFGGAYPFPFDIFSYSAAAAAAAASMAAAQGVVAAAAAAGKMPSMMSPYLPSYARSIASASTTPSCNTSAADFCKDPYCSQCQLTAQVGGVGGGCTHHHGASCSQCHHSKPGTVADNLSSLAATIGPPSSSLSGMPLFSGATAAAAASLLYPGSAFSSALSGSLLGPSGLPPPPSSYICPMLSGVGELCAKRCTNSEEFLQHLQTHTPGGFGGDPGLMSYPQGISQLSSLSCLRSPSLGRSFYPSMLDSLSQSSNLRHAAFASQGLSPAVSAGLLSSRFHPYKSSLSSTPLSSALAYTASAQALEAYRTLHAQRTLGIAP